ncbi:hypothetical protein NL503_29960, partial [Klebsiella pneumoniae]|nr:hypothetical protein [Klebsiella pneumoniae]
LSAKTPFELIYPIYAKYQSHSITNDLKFEQDINDLALPLQPKVEIQIDDYSDIKPDETEEDKEDYRTVADIIDYQS